MLRLLTIAALAAASPTAVAAQAPPPDETNPVQASQPATRQAAIEQEQAAKVPTLHPHVPDKGEQIFQRIDTLLAGGQLRWHPFFESAYAGGGFTPGRRPHELRERL